MPTTRNLFAADARLDALTTQYGQALEDDLLAVLKALRLRINALAKLLKTQGGRVSQTSVNLGVAARAEAEVLAALRVAGYARVVDQAIGRLPSLAPVALQASASARRVFALTKLDAQTIEAFRRLKLAELGGVGDALARDVAKTILKGAVGAQSASELVFELAELLDGPAAQARTIYETGIGEFVQTLEALHSENTPEEAFLYSGPIDARVRPFCEGLVGQVLSREEIDSLDNGQMPNTFLTRGGYNCRHHWRRVTGELAGQADSGEVASDWAREQLDALPGLKAAGKRAPLKRAA